MIFGYYLMDCRVCHSKFLCKKDTWKPKDYSPHDEHDACQYRIDCYCPKCNNISLQRCKARFSKGEGNHVEVLE